jgi:MFS family permease
MAGTTTVSKPPAPPSATNADFVAMMLVIMNEAIAITMLFPFVGLLIVRLEPGMSRADAGKLSGLLVGSFQIAQAMFASVWGRKSDRLGRRPMIAVGLIGGAFFSILFGMSTHVWQLLLFRFLYGVANGNAPLVKTMVAEMATRGNEASGWAMMSAGWSLGSTLGPIIGGTLYDPASHMDSFKGTIFETRPALLPSLFAAGYSVFALGITLFFLPESNVRANPPAWVARLMACGRSRRPPVTAEAMAREDVRYYDEAEEGGEVQRRNDSLAGHSITSLPAASDPTTSESTGNAATVGVSNSSIARAPPTQQQHEAAVVVVVTSSSSVGGDGGEEEQAAADHEGDDTAPLRPTASYGLYNMFMDPGMRYVLCSYIAIASFNTSFMEVFPLLAILPVSQGGLGVDASVIGVIYTCFALQTIIGNIAYPKVIERRGGAEKAPPARVVSGPFMMLHAALPAVNWHHNIPLVVAACAALSLPRVWGATWAFSTLTMGIAASAPKEHLGAATGISHSCGNVARAIVPSFMTYLFAWSVKYASGGEADESVTSEPSATSPVAMSEQPQSFFGPAFPFNRWLVFFLIAAGLYGIVFGLRNAGDALFQRVDKEVNGPDAAERKKQDQQNLAARRDESRDGIELQVSSPATSSNSAPPREANESPRDR